MDCNVVRQLDVFEMYFTRSELDLLITCGKFCHDGVSTWHALNCLCGELLSGDELSDGILYTIHTTKFN